MHPSVAAENASFGGVYLRRARWLLSVLVLVCFHVGAAGDERDARLRARGLDPASVPDPFAHDEAMHELAQDVAGEGSATERLQRLQDFLFDEGAVVFDYETDRTLTAIEAFAERRGNCVSFTNLFIGLARSIGIAVQPALLSFREADETAGDLIVVRNHILAVHRAGGVVTVFDFYLRRSGTPLGIRVVDDLWGAAIFSSNRGVTALMAGHTAAAIDRFETARKLAPLYAAVYSNLGVALRRSGDLRAALDVYLLALTLEPRNASVRRNTQVALSELVTGRGAVEPDEAEPRVVAMEKLATFELLRGAPRAAETHFRAWSRMDATDPEPVLGLARCGLLRGKVRRARRDLQRALRMQPDHPEARRLLDGLDTIDRERAGR